MSVHNIWVMDWPVIVTVVGWISLIKGFGLLAYPDFVQSFSFLFKKSLTFYRLLGTILTLLGLFLLYQAW